MELQTNNRLDLTLNKDDLMEIILDEQLSKIEDVIQEKEHAIQELDKQDAKNDNEHKELVDKILIKYIPKPLVGLKCELRYYINYDSTQVTFHYDNFDVVVQGVCTNSPKRTEHAKKDKEFNTKRTILRQEINALKSNIEEIKKNGKRLKARMLKQFLMNTEDGKTMLELLEKNANKPLLLPSK